ncbi:MAG: winged helix-turn-helix transcriptional regulator [Planctomycetes bacterium]|nr:winged helix-turn-helix transcriptional regulator [Planctomycetota bacterium]MBL7040374.1 winged helix-turn-helix transcriptional regulator [Pirellulaceae bacterium]
MPQLARPSGIPAGIDDLGPVELLRLVSQCERELRRTLADRVRRWGISDVELLVLWLCCEAREPGIAQNELAVAVGVSAAQMSGLVECLRQRGLLAAKRCAEDRRRQYWTLADEGSRMMNEIRTDFGAVSVALTKHLSVDEQKLLASLLERLVRAAERPLALRAVTPDIDDSGQHREVHDENTKKD